MSSFKSGDGVMPGDYVITVLSWVPGSGPSPADERAGVGVTSAIPECYKSVDTSDLRQTVGKTLSSPSFSANLWRAIV
jgi:hypothetical protein